MDGHMTGREEVSVMEKTNLWFHTASGDKSACFHRFLPPVTWVTGPNRDTPSCACVSNMKTHSKLGPQVCSNQGQGRPWGREQGRRKGQREPSMPACHLEWQRMRQQRRKGNRIMQRWLRKSRVVA